ncbi:choline transporter-like 2 [Culicoides brevitarsis]|uniref:choline transporter-like 2 n=1 Tax=Culicoides brevitarsis TaxID=469753 RepID=UPI00307B66CD
MDLITESTQVGILNEETRRPTNVNWLYAFLIAVASFVILGAIANNSDGPSGIFYSGHFPVEDIRGSHCGIDSDVLDKSYKMHIDDRNCDGNRFNCHENWICVNSCPNGFFDVSSCTSDNFWDLKTRLVCQDDKLPAKIQNCEEMQAAVDDKKCARWYKDTSKIFGNCISSHNEADVDFNNFQVSAAHKILMVIPSFMYALICAGIVSLFLIVTLKWSAAFVFWGFVVLIIVALVAFMLSIICVQIPSASKSNDGMNEIYFQLLIVAVVLALLILILYCLRRKIRCGIEIVKESSRCVCASIESIFFPVLPLLLRAAVFIAMMYILVMAFTMQHNEYHVQGRDPDCFCKNVFYDNYYKCYPKTFNSDCRRSDGGICTQKICQLKSQRGSNLSKPMIMLTVILSSWIGAFIQAAAKMILAHVYANWYWNWNKRYIPAGSVGVAMTKIAKNHLGSAAFGGFVVMMLRRIRKMLKKQKCSCCSCFAWCCCCPCKSISSIFGCVLRYFLKAAVDLLLYVSDKAFVVVAMTGYGFWDSVKSVSRVMTKDVPLVVATEYVGDIILFVCKFVTAILTAGTFFITSPFKGNDEIITLIISFLIFSFTFDLVAVLLTSYNVAIDTLLICTIQDFMNSGVEKPYFQSQVLNGLLFEKKEVELV